MNGHPNGMYNIPPGYAPQGYPPMQPGMGAPMHPGMQPPGQQYMNPSQFTGQGYVMMGQQYPPPQQQQHDQLPPTDEEQMWLEQQMEQAQRSGSAPLATTQATDPVAAAEMEALAAAAQPVQPAPAASEDSQEGYEDVMKLIEENRRRNEAKRAAQSKRNAEIVAAFEARTSGAE